VPLREERGEDGGNADRPPGGAVRKTIDAFNDVLTQSEIEAYEFGFTLAARLMMDVVQTMELPSIDDI
jgi:hypothetical protein